jgi:biotin carboxylase
MKVLLATTLNWFSTARLATALGNVGFIVEAVCPSHHSVSKTRLAPRTYPYNGLAGSSSFQEAIDTAQPDLVIPCDVTATAHLHELYAEASAARQNTRATRELVMRSLGDPASYPIINSRSKFIALAREEGIAAPETVQVNSVGELREWLECHEVPAVLKTDGSYGGAGVRIVNSSEEADRGFGALKVPPLGARAASRAIFDRDLTMVVPAVLRKAPTINVQEFITGRDAFIAIACWEGTVDASISAEALQVWENRGPSSVVRLIDNREMLEAAEKLASRLGLSGLHGLDFIIEKRTGEAHLIEINPRATPICHLALGAGRNLPSALFASLSGQPPRNGASATDCDIIALFPQEWQRDPASVYLRCGYHDVPMGRT